MHFVPKLYEGLPCQGIEVLVSDLFIGFYQQFTFVIVFILRIVGINQHIDLASEETILRFDRT